MALTSKQVKKIFDLWAAEYDAAIPLAEWGFEHHREGMDWVCSRLAKAPPGGRVIDLGCGTGILGEKLHRCCPLMEYTGIDLSPKMLQIARKKLPRALFLQADMRDFRRWRRYLENGPSSTVIVSTYALHHLTDQEKIKLIKRIFASGNQPGRQFLIVDYAFRNPEERRRMLRGQLKRGRHHIYREILQEYYADISALRRALAGSRISVAVERNGIWDWRIALCQTAFF